VKKPVIQRPKADGAINTIVWYLVRESSAAARAFLEAIERSYDILREQPGIGSTRHAPYVPELPLPLRFHPITRFPRILIDYLDRPEAA
jgi:plasmid stabilization system protein ParE